MSVFLLPPKDVTDGVVESPRRAPQKCQRPTDLILRRPSSATPYGRRPPDISTPPASEHLEFHQLKEILLKKSGVLCYNFERINATKEDFIDEGQLGAENKRIMMDLDVVTKCVGCPNIVKCMGIFFSMSEVWICMEVMSMSLDTLMRDTVEPFPEYVLGKIAVSIVKALDYLKREHNIMHRDVKPSNMLLSSGGDIKLCDFGISGQLKDSISNSNQFGCIGYMAPERLEKFKYDVRADIWSLGISLVELALKSFPYKGSQFEFAILSKIIEDPPPKLPDDGRYSIDFCSFVDACLIKDYNLRPKYPALRKTKLFVTYDRKPYDVGDWYRTVRLILPGNGGLSGSGRHTPISPASSTVTLSPDGNKSAHWLDGGGSEVDSFTNGGAVRRGSGGSVTQQQQRETSLSRRSPAPSIFMESSPSVNLCKDIGQKQRQTMTSNWKAQVLPPSGANSSPTLHDSQTGGYASSVGENSGQNSVILRNRGRSLFIPGRNLSMVSSGAAHPPIAVDARRNAYYPHLSGGSGESNGSPNELSNTYHTNLQAYFNFLNQQPHKPPAYYNTAPRASNSRPSILPPSTSSSPTPAQRQVKIVALEGYNGYPSTGNAISSPRSPRSVSAGYNGSGRRIQRAPACRHITKPYQPTRVVNNSTSVFSFSASTPNKATEDEATPPAEPQKYHHEFYWYAHQPPAQQQPQSQPPA
nr:dual specificity mitogen activated protein [Hymenolepis microstoma]